MPEPTASTALPPMADVLEKTVRAESKGKKLLGMKIARTEEGIIIDLQSDVDWIGALKDKRQKEPAFRVAGVECYQAKPVELHDTAVYWNLQDFVMRDNLPNMTILLAKGLQDGRRFVCQQPMSADALLTWAKSVRAAATEAFNSYLRPVDIEMTITIESNEKQKLG